MKMIGTKFLGLTAEYWLFILGLVVCIAVLGFSNFSTNYLVGDESYLYLRTLGGEDSLSFGGRDVEYPVGFGVLIGFFGGDIFAVKLIHFVFGVLSFVIFFFILKKLSFLREDRLFAMFLLVLSPGFIYLFSFSGSSSAAMFFSLLIFLLLIYNNHVLASVFLLIVPFFNVLIALINFGLFLIGYFKIKYSFVFLTSLLLSLSLIIGLYGVDVIHNADVNFVDLVSDLGSDYGFGFFTLVLSVFGFVLLWKSKYNYLFFYFLFLILFVWLFYLREVLFYFTFILVVFAALGLHELLSRKWEISLVKHFSLLLLILGVVFSGLSYLERANDLGPDKETIEGLMVLKELEHHQDAVIFSHFSNGNWITYYTKRENFMDTNYLNAPDLDKRLRDHDLILYSGSENVVRDLLKYYDVEYIFLDRNILEKLEINGLLRVFNLDRNNYKLVYDKGVQIWRVER